MLGVVGSNLKMVKFLHDVVVVWPGSCNNVAPGHAHQFHFQLATYRTLQQGGQTRATMLRPTMLRSVAFKCCERLAGACKMLGQQCWDMLR